MTKQVAVRDAHTCALDSTGRAWCWGDDTGGQLGDGPDNQDKHEPVPVAGDHIWTLP